MSTMKDLARIVADRHDMEVQDSEQFVSNMFDVIIQALTTDEQVKVKGLGTFKIQTVRERASININTGEKVIINSHERIAFTPDTAMRNSVNKPFAHFETVPLNDGVVFDDMIEEEEENEKGKEEIAEKTDHKTENKEQKTEDREQDTENKEQNTEIKGDYSDTQDSVSMPVYNDTILEQKAEADAVQGSISPENIPAEATEDDMLDISQQNHENNSAVEPEETGNDEEVLPEPVAIAETTNVTSAVVTEYKEQTSTEDTTLTDEKQHEPTDDYEQAQRSDDGETASIAQNTNTGNKNSPAIALLQKEDIPQEEEFNNEDMANSQDFNNDPSRNGNNMSTATSILIGLLLLIVGFVIGRATADITFEDIKNMVLQEEKPVEVEVVYEEIDTPTDTIDGAVHVDTIIAEKESAKQNPIDTIQTTKPQPAEQIKENKQTDTKKEAEAKKPANENIPAGKYDSDPRIRTGAYNIVGIREIVTVQKGQTLASISKAHLGPGMECYIEALNGKGEVKVGQNVKIPELKLKKARK